MKAPLHRQLSKALLGSQYRAEIAAALGEAETPVSAQELADRTGIRYPRVQEELKHLLAAGMLEEAPSIGRQVLYVKVRSQYWDSCEALLSEWRSR